LYIVTSLRGFPEFLLNGQLVERQVIETFPQVFELHGFGSVDTRAVEPPTGGALPPR
jgi:histidyl-tRNA synthetase